MYQKMLFIKKIEEGLNYIKNYDLDLYNSVLLKLQEIEKNETDDFIINLEKRKILSPIVYDAFVKSGVTLELSSEVNEFSKCNYILTKEKEVTVSGKYDIIGQDCFLFSPQVETIIFEDGVKWIDENACQNLKNLRTVYFPETLKSIGSCCFANCTNLEKVVFENKKSCIDPSAFKETLWFERMKDEFVIINNQLLKYNGNNENVVIPEGVHRIGFSVFENNEKIKSLVCPSTLKTIGVASFLDCVNLEKVVLNDEIETIEAMAFEGCVKLDELILPKSIVHFCVEAIDTNTKVIFA